MLNTASKLQNDYIEDEAMILNMNIEYIMECFVFFLKMIQFDKTMKSFIIIFFGISITRLGFVKRRPNVLKVWRNVSREDGSVT